VDEDMLLNKFLAFKELTALYPACLIFWHTPFRTSFLVNLIFSHTPHFLAPPHFYTPPATSIQLVFPDTSFTCISNSTKASHGTPLAPCVSLGSQGEILEGGILLHPITLM